MAQDIGSVGTSAAEYADQIGKRHRDLAEKTASPATLLSNLLGEDGTGSPLPPDVEQRMAGQLAFDAGMARMHAGPAAAEAARHLKADAFTIGRDVFFAQGKLDPRSSKGLGLVAHELTH